MKHIPITIKAKIIAIDKKSKVPYTVKLPNGNIANFKEKEVKIIKHDPKM